MAGRHRAIDLVLPHLRVLDGYEAVDPPEVLAERAGIPVSEVVKLDANENPYGPSSKVAEALASLRDAHLYPDPAQGAMRAAVGRYVGLAPEHVVVGNGSDEIIDLLFRAVLGPGDAVVNSVPTFGMYEFTAQVCNARIVEIERDDAFAVDIDAVLAAAGEQHAKIIAIASPNNPSGNPTSPEDIERLLASDCLVIVDEAYAEFGDSSVAALVPKRPSLVVLRSMSKWAGLAGLRVGYGLMDAALAEVLMRAKPPYNVNQAAEAALLASLADAEALQERVRLIVAERARMHRLLDAIPGVTPLPSEANFILCRLPEGRGRDVHERLAGRGVFVRYYARGVLADYLRISVGKPADTDRLIASLIEALSETLSEA